MLSTSVRWGMTRKAKFSIQSAKVSSSEWKGSKGKVSENRKTRIEKLSQGILKLFGH